MRKNWLKRALGLLLGSVIFQALLLALIIRSLIFQPFSIPSGSMKPTLLVGDYIFVTKWSYGFSAHSLPFGERLPLPSGRLWSGSPERGDIAVFKYPLDPSTNYIKRVIGLPGDKVQLRNSVLYINGAAVKRIETGVFTDIVNGRNFATPIHSELLASGRSYGTLDITPNARDDTTPIFEVPPNHYFFMGDNRDNSAE